MSEPAAQTGHDITSLKVCNGQGSHAEIVYDAEEAGAKGCPLCLALDELALMDRENHQLRCQLDSERAGAVEGERD